MAKSYNLNLNAILDELDKNSLTVYEEVSADADLKTEINKALDYTLPLWMAGSTNDAAHRALLLDFDAIANIGWFSMREKQEFRMKLLGCIGTGRPVRHKFINSGGSRKSFSNLLILLRLVYPDARQDDVATWVRSNDEDSFKELVKLLGYQSDEAKDLLKEYTAFKKELV